MVRLGACTELAVILLKLTDVLKKDPVLFEHPLCVRCNLYNALGLYSTFAVKAGVKP